jgi:hypothetical protein
MATKNGARESRSVRLYDHEWVMAEALARLEGEQGAGFGLRQALKRETQRVRRSSQGTRLEALMNQIIRERADGEK